MAVTNLIERALGAAGDWWRSQTEKSVVVYQDFHGTITTEDLPEHMLRESNFRPVGEGTLTRRHPLTNWRLDEGTVVQYEQPEA